MSQFWILAAILLPILGGALVPFLPFGSRKKMMIYLEILMLTTSAIVLALVFHGPMEVFHVIYFVRGLSISFKIDGMTMIFGGLIAVLWPLAMLYSFEYMEHEGHEKVFFCFYSITYGVTLGIAFASDMLSMYFFYELLTLVTVPLILHSLSREAILAVRKYLYYSVGGAAFALIGLIFLIVYGDTCEFGMLPQAGVAPTPVTALLHAVAVVKAGVFAIIRLTYYSFGADFLRGTWVQNIVMAFAVFTIVYGCSKAVKETHIKRRLAYSTVSNLSYIIFAATIMTPLGLVGALSHLICHAVMKICSFLCAGAIMHQTKKSYIYELNGMGRKMPVVFGCFTVSALALMGVPGLAGFVSKWNIAQAAVESGNVLAYVGIGALLISALLTAIYMLTIVVRAFLPAKEFDYGTIAQVKDPSWKMCLPLLLFAVTIVVLGLCFAPVTAFFMDVAAGIY